MPRTIDQVRARGLVNLLYREMDAQRLTVKELHKALKFFPGKRKWRAYLVAQKGICPLCAGPLLAMGDTLSIDHVVPLSRGGGNYLNRLLVHQSCNKRKGNKAPTPELITYAAEVGAMVGDFHQQIGVDRRPGEVRESWPPIG